MCNDQNSAIFGNLIERPLDDTVCQGVSSRGGLVQDQHLCERVPGRRKISR